MGANTLDPGFEREVPQKIVTFGGADLKRRRNAAGGVGSTGCMRYRIEWRCG